MPKVRAVRRYRANLRLIALPFLLLAGAGITGCAHYRLGSGTEPSFRALYVAPVGNPASIPQAEAVIGSILREHFISDGRVNLVNSPEDADAVLQVSLTGYTRTPATARPDDTGLARKLALNLSANVTLHDRRSASDLFAGRVVNVSRDAFTDNGQQQAEYEALPLLAEALASQIVHAALDVW